MSGNARKAILDKTKEGFFHLCVQYEHLGKLLHLQSKAFSSKIIEPDDDNTAPRVLEKMLAQYQEIGEQLKVVGTGLDQLGGEPVLQPEDPKGKG